MGFGVRAGEGDLAVGEQASVATPYSTIDDEGRALIMRRSDASALRRHATAAGMTTLREDGFGKAAAGITTEGEVLRATRDEDG